MIQVMFREAAPTWLVVWLACVPMLTGTNLSFQPIPRMSSATNPRKPVSRFAALALQ